MDEILEQFLIEARDNLSYLDKHLKDLQNSDEETVNALFRAAHTLKGGAGLVMADHIKEITHAAEDLLDAYRNSEIKYSDEIVDVLYDAFDEVIELVDAIEESGSVNVDVDEKRISNFKNSIRNLLTQNSNKNENELDIPFEIDNSLKLSHYFSILQIQQLAKNAPINEPQITKEFLKQDQFWIGSFDLDVDTLKLGNDPIYLFSMIQNAQTTQACVICNKQDTKSDLLEWNSYIVACIKSNVDEIENIFYNILDEVTFRPLSIRFLLECDYESIENDTYDDFKEELSTLMVDDKELDEKLSAITQILNPKSKEGCVLLRLQAILVNFEVGSKEYKDIVKIAFDILGVKLSNKSSKKSNKQEEVFMALGVDFLCVLMEEVEMQLLRLQIQV